MNRAPRITIALGICSLLGTAAAAALLLLLLQLAIACAAAAAAPTQFDAATTIRDGAGEQITWQSARRQMQAVTPQVRMKVRCSFVQQQIMSFCT